jgi:hypothetical protein
MKPDYRDWNKDPPEKSFKSIIVRGIWQPSISGAKGREEFLAIANWSSLKSDGTGYDWYLAYGFCPLSAFNVKITHWAAMFEGLGND